MRRGHLMREPYQLDAFAEELPERAAPSPLGVPPLVCAPLPDPSPFASRPNAQDDEAGDVEWHWSENEEDIVLGEQRAVAVYRNGSQGIVIREQSPDGEREDHFVVLRDDAAAKALITRLQQEVGAKR